MILFLIAMQRYEDSSTVSNFVNSGVLEFTKFSYKQTIAPKRIELKSLKLIVRNDIKTYSE